MPSVFFIGATGYVGGSVLVKIRERFPDWPITALVRKEQHVDAVRATGVEVVQPLASKDQYQVIAEEVYKAELTINVADCDDVKLCESILGAMKKKVEDGKPKGVFLHTSGAMLFNDLSADGNAVDGSYWNDNSEEDMKNIDPDALHGPVDTRVLKAGEEGYVTNYTLCPAAVVGTGSGPVKVPSIFVKMLIQYFTAAKRPLIAAEGTSRYNYVHIDDLVDLYLRLLEVIVSGEQANDSSYARYYIGDSTEIPFKTVAEVYGTELTRLGLLPTAKVESIPRAQVDGRARVFGADMRIRGDRAHALGWNPRPVDMRETIVEDIKVALEAMGLEPKAKA
ncbi:unnamed protein product [Peniophora sp. CBMAI 1063]|nr:unnamed protein product [Peniophora sp. CBMAI 1063]